VHYALAMVRLLLPLALASLLGCGGAARSVDAEAAAPAGSVGTASAATSTPGGPDWRSYPPAPGDSWPTRPLDDERWVRAAGDLGCIGRAHHGDPVAHREAMNRVLAHHETTAAEVMTYGIAVNSDARAGALGGRVSQAVETCR
jgi:hypothetical protein